MSEFFVRNKNLLRNLGIGFSVVLGTIAVMVVVVNLGSQSSQNSLSSASVIDTLAPDDWISGGDAKTGLVLIEYSDFQCPACGSYYPVLKQLRKDFGSSIAFVYRHFPLTQIHKNAELAAYAGEAAGRQGKFWEMHDLLFENQPKWAEENNARDEFVHYAASLNLDSGKFVQDLDSQEVRASVEKDYAKGISLGVDATPTFFLNGHRIKNPQSYNEFRDLIKQALGA